MNFASTWQKLLKYCISAEFLLVEGYVQGALRKELNIDPFVERFKTATFGKYYQIKVITTWKNLPKHYIFADFLPIVSYTQSTLRKEQLITSFVVLFKNANLRKSY